MVCVLVVAEQAESENDMRQGGSDAQRETSIQSRAVLSFVSPGTPPRKPSSPADGNRKLIPPSEEQKESQCEQVVWRHLDEELLSHVLHEVGSALMVILCQAELVERDMRKKAIALTHELAREQSLERVPDQMSRIISQVQLIEQLMTSMADAAWMRQDVPLSPTSGSDF